MQPARAGGHADADLARPFRHGDQQDIHDADAADDQRNRGDRGEQQFHGFRTLFRHFRDLSQVAHHEIIGLARENPVCLLESLGDLIKRGLHQRRAAGLNENGIDEALQLRHDAEGIGRRPNGCEHVVRQCLRGGGRCDAQNALLRRGERNEYHIVLILAAGGMTLRGQDPNHRHRDIFHQHRGADRVGEFAKQVGKHGLTQEAHDRAVVIVLIVERAARHDRPAAN